MGTADGALFEVELFPLAAVLFPGGRLPLRIFEVRYLDLIRRCGKSGSPFGVVALTEGSEVRRRRRAADEHGRPVEDFDREAFHATGTLAVIEAVEQTLPGLMTIRCRGSERFRLHSTELLRHGLWTGSAERLPEDAAVPIPDDLLRCSMALQDMLRHLPVEARPADPPPHVWEDCGWVANRWCELLPIAIAERQRLLELDNPLLRLELVADRLAGLRETAP